MSQVYFFFQLKKMKKKTTVICSFCLMRKKNGQFYARRGVDKHLGSNFPINILKSLFCLFFSAPAQKKKRNEFYAKRRCRQHSRRDSWIWGFIFFLYCLLLSNSEPFEEAFKCLIFLCHVPDSPSGFFFLKIEYAPDFRQRIADTWPRSIDDSIARK